MLALTFIGEGIRNGEGERDRERWLDLINKNSPSFLLLSSFPPFLRLFFFVPAIKSSYIASVCALSVCGVK